MLACTINYEALREKFTKKEKTKSLLCIPCGLESTGTSTK